MNKLLEFNLKLFSQVVLLANTHNCTCTSVHYMRMCTEAQDLHVYTSAIIFFVGWSEPANVYFLSHDNRAFYTYPFFIQFAGVYSFCKYVLSSALLSNSRQEKGLNIECEICDVTGNTHLLLCSSTRCVTL